MSGVSVWIVARLAVPVAFSVAAVCYCGGVSLPLGRVEDRDSLWVSLLLVGSVEIIYLPRGSPSQPQTTIAFLPPTAARGPRNSGVLSLVCLVDGPLPIWHNVGMARLRPYDLVERVLARDPLELGGRFYTLPELLEVLGDRDAPATVEGMADALSEHLGVRVGVRTIIRWRDENTRRRDT